MNMLKHTVLTTLSELEKFEKDWNVLHIKSKTNNPFLDYYWIYNWWHVYGKNNQLRIILLYYNNELITILPLFEDYSYKLRILKFIGDPWSDDLDILCEGKNYEIAVKYLSELLIKKEINWDILQLSEIPTNHHILTQIRFIEEKQHKYYLIKEFDSPPSPIIKINQNFDEFWSDRNKHIQHNVKRYLNALKKKGCLTFRLLRREETKRALDFLFSQHPLRAEKKDSFSTTLSYNNREFFDKIFNELLPKHCECPTLFLNNEMIALCISFNVNGKYLFYFPCVHQEIGNYSLGRMLNYFMIRRAFDLKCKIFDFGRGDENYKYDYANSEIKKKTVQVYSSRSIFIYYYVVNNIKNSVYKNHYLHKIIRQIYYLFSKDRDFIPTASKRLQK